MRPYLVLSFQKSACRSFPKLLDPFLKRIQSQKGTFDFPVKQTSSRKDEPTLRGNLSDRYLR